MLLTMVLLAFGVGVIQDKPTLEKPPKKGDTVVVRGCIAGGVIETGELSSQDGEYKHLELHNYRMTGKKDVLKTLKEQHGGHADVVTGVLKTDLPTDRKGMSGRIGGTGVGIGLGSPQASTERALPVLEVTAFEHVEMRCR